MWNLFINQLHTPCYKSRLFSPPLDRSMWKWKFGQKKSSVQFSFVFNFSIFHEIWPVGLCSGRKAESPFHNNKMRTKKTEWIGLLLMFKWSIYSCILVTVAFARLQRHGCHAGFSYKLNAILTVAGSVLLASPSAVAYMNSLIYVL